MYICAKCIIRARLNGNKKSRQPVPVYFTLYRICMIKTSSLGSHIYPYSFFLGLVTFNAVIL